jgi:hypothetical protein
VKGQGQEQELQEAKRQEKEQELQEVKGQEKEQEQGQEPHRGMSRELS